LGFGVNGFRSEIFRVYGLGLRGKGLGFGDKRFGVWGLGFGDKRFGVWGLGIKGKVFGVWGLGI
jgi:hypothetical protein